MIWLGLGKAKGYSQHVVEFERTGKPLPKKIRKSLAAQLARAKEEIARIERALEGSNK